jgi:steroid 5-alpha reductase family enzyme
VSALGVLPVNLVVVLAGMVGLWMISNRLDDVSFVDAAWAFGFVVIGLVTFALTDGDRTRAGVIVGVTAVWGVRLGTYLLWRWRRSGPDPRYRAMERRAGDDIRGFRLRRVFLVQGVLMWIVSLPVQLGQIARTPRGLTAVGYIGLALCAVGIAFESIGDAQLVRFKADPESAGKVLDRGLWRYTRHPNYFGDACTWWGLLLISVTSLGTAAGVIGPIAITTLLLRWSGVTLLERRLTRTRPEYVDYVRRTSAFIPMPPRRVAPGSSGSGRDA